jgi:hypothetical protein
MLAVAFLQQGDAANFSLVPCATGVWEKQEITTIEATWVVPLSTVSFWALLVGAFT